MKCKHEVLDMNDECENCGTHIQMYTSCVRCDWFGIPINEGMANELCYDCELEDTEQ